MCWPRRAALLDPDLRARVRLVVAGDDRFVPDADRTLSACRRPRRRRASGWSSRAGSTRRSSSPRSTSRSFPSVRAESFGLVAAEAMAAGLPLVVSDAGRACPRSSAPPPVGGAARRRAALAEALAWRHRRTPADDVTAAQRRAVGGRVLPGRRPAAPWPRSMEHCAGPGRIVDTGPASHEDGRDAGPAWPSRTTTSPSAAAPNASCWRCCGRSPTPRCTPCSTTPTAPSRSSATPASSPRRSTASRRCATTTAPRCRCWRRAASRMTVDADVTVVSTSGWAHGFDVRGRSVVYCHNPARWLYQGEDYLGGRSRSLAGLVLGTLAPRLRRWDRAAMLRHDAYLVNATVVRERVRAAYGIDAQVVFPPTVVHPEGGEEQVGPFDPGFHLVVSRLLPYKNVDKAVDAFRDAARRTTAGDRSRARGGHGCAHAARQRRDRLRRQRRPAALGLPPRGGAGGAQHRGLRTHPARGRRLRQADPRAARRRLPRHGGRGGQRAVLRPSRRRRASRRRSRPGGVRRGTRRRSCATAAASTRRPSGRRSMPPSTDVLAGRA